MSYTVLARKYRSQSFDDIIGQEAISQTLKNSIKTSRVAHAFLFVGTRGIGKTTMARVLAKALNCLSFDQPTTEPCCKCQSCISINTGDDIDVIEIDGASNNGVEQVRQLRENAVYRPARSRYKIYIIDEVHMLSVAAFNALLKILEEPPGHVKFIFATTEPNKVIPTIQSRCQRFDFCNISSDQIAEHLGQVLLTEGIKYDHDVVLYLAKMARGSMRDGLSLLDRLISVGIEPLTVELLEQFLGCPQSEKVYSLLKNIGQSDPQGVLSSIEDLINGGITELQILDAVVDLVRDLMLFKTAGADSSLLVISDEQKKRLSAIVENFDIASIVYMIGSLENIRWSIKNSEMSRALLEACFLRLALSEHFLNIDQALAKLFKSGGAQLKKKAVADTDFSASDKKSSSEPDTVDISLAFGEITSIKERWQEVLDSIAEKVNKATAGLLRSSQPAAFSQDAFRIEFSSAGTMAKKMCEQAGRKSEVEKFFSGIFGQEVKLEFAIESESADTKSPKKQVNSSERRKQIMNDQGVKTVLIELDATITNIDEKKQLEL